MITANKILTLTDLWHSAVTAHTRMNKLISGFLFLLLLTGCSDRREKNWDVEKLDELERYGNKIGTSSFILITDGEIVKQWGDVASPSKVHSIRKSILSALVGQHLVEGKDKIRLVDDPPLR